MNPNTSSTRFAEASALKEQCVRLIKQNQKLQAVKFYMDETGAKLQKAKDVIEAWEKELAQHESQVHQPAGGLSAEDNLKQKCLPLLKSDNRLEAVKLYKDETGVGLKEAKDQIDAWYAELVRQGAVTPPKGCGTTVILAILSIGVMGVILL